MKLTGRVRNVKISPALPWYEPCIDRPEASLYKEVDQCYQLVISRVTGFFYLSPFDAGMHSHASDGLF